MLLCTVPQRELLTAGWATSKRSELRLGVADWHPQPAETPLPFFSTHACKDQTWKDKTMFLLCMLAEHAEHFVIGRLLHAATTWMQRQSEHCFVFVFRPTVPEHCSDALPSLLKAWLEKWDRNAKHCRAATLKLNISINSAAAAPLDTPGLIYGSVTRKHIKRR